MTEQSWEKLPKVFTPALKKRVSAEWAPSFPEFGMRKPLVFEKMVGCLSYVMAMEVKSSRETYTPWYDVTNLSSDMDFMVSTLPHQLITTRDTPDSIRLCFHDLYYREAAKRMREQAILPLEGPISLREVITAYQTHAERYRHLILYDHNIDDPAMICAWAGRPDLVEECLTWGQTLIASLEERRKPPHGKDPAVWLERMRSLVSDPDRLRQTTRNRVILHKLTKIPYQDFSDAEYKEAS